MVQRITGFLLSIALLSSLACGGGSGGPAGPQEYVLVLKPMEGLSGGVSSDGGAALLDVAPVGDDGSLVGYRIVQCFDISRVPAGVEIVSAVYQNEQLAVQDGPYGALGQVSLLVTNVGAVLGGEDYDPAGSGPMLGVLSSNAALEVKTLDMTGALVSALAGPGDRLDLRIQFRDEHNGDLGGDYASFYGRAQVGDVPGIVVRYRR